MNLGRFLSYDGFLMVILPFVNPFFFSVILHSVTLQRAGRTSAFVYAIVNTSLSHALAAAVMKPPKVRCSHGVTRVSTLVQRHALRHKGHGAVYGFRYPRRVHHNSPIRPTRNVLTRRDGFWLGLKPRCVKVDGESDRGPPTLKILLFCQNVKKVGHRFLQVPDLTVRHHIVSLVWFWAQLHTGTALVVQIAETVKAPLATCIARE